MLYPVSARGGWVSQGGSVGQRGEIWACIRCPQGIFPRAQLPQVWLTQHEHINTFTLQQFIGQAHLGSTALHE